jgi:hypothetical protein
MATRHATVRVRRRSAVQLNHIGIAEDANKKTDRHLLLCDQHLERGARRSHRRILLFPVMVVAAARGSARSAALGRLRYTKVQIDTSFVVASFTLVQLWRLPIDGIQDARNPSFWVTHAWHRDSQDPEVWSF